MATSLGRWLRSHPPVHSTKKAFPSEPLLVTDVASVAHLRLEMRRPIEGKVKVNLDFKTALA